MCCPKNTLAVKLQFAPLCPVPGLRRPSKRQSGMALLITEKHQLKKIIKKCRNAG